MTMKKSIILFALLIVGSVVSAQQLQHYSQYIDNLYTLNPAVAGANGVYDARSLNRYQWVGMTDAPRTYTLSLNGPLKNPKMGVGGYLYTDIAGAFRRTGFNLSYAYHIQLGEKLRLAAGLSAGIQQFATDFSKNVSNDPNDPAIDDNLASVLLPDLGVGLYLYSDKLFFSIAAPQVIPFKVQYFGDYPGTSSKLANHFYISAGYKIALGESIAIQPAINLKYVNPAPLQAELTLRALYKDQLWVGGSYRRDFATGSSYVPVMAGYTFQDNLTVGYSYDLILSGLKNYSSGSHELMIGIRFKNRGVKSPHKASIE